MMLGTPAIHHLLLEGVHRDVQAIEHYCRSHARSCNGYGEWWTIGYEPIVQPRPFQ